MRKHACTRVNFLFLCVCVTCVCAWCKLIRNQLSNSEPTSNNIIIKHYILTKDYLSENYWYGCWIHQILTSPEPLPSSTFPSGVDATELKGSRSNKCLEWVANGSPTKRINKYGFAHKWYTPIAYSWSVSLIIKTISIYGRTYFKKCTSFQWIWGIVLPDHQPNNWSSSNPNILQLSTKMDTNCLHRHQPMGGPKPHWTSTATGEAKTEGLRILGLLGL